MVETMKWRALAVALTAMTVTSSLGVISGTMAWFAYTTRASLSLDGTTVNNSEQLQIGLKFENDNTIQTFESLVEESNVDVDSTFDIVKEEGFTYYFVKPGAPLSSVLVSAYSKSQGHATNELIPVTSREYKMDQFDFTKNPHLTLNRAPTKGEPNLNQKASNESFSYLNLAFRVLRSSYGAGSVSYMKNRDIWLKDVTTHAGLHLENSLRIFVNSETGNFILNPNANEKGETTVAGLLNLDYGDDYYDYDPSSYFYQPKELIYGDYSLKEGMKDNASLFETDSDLDDINKTNTKTPSSFLAKHQNGIMGYRNLDNFDLKKAQYYSMKEIQPSDDAGYLQGGHVVCRTSDKDSAIASIKLTIYLEGWDHSITNEALDEQERNGGTGFDLGLTFQTNRVD